MRHIASEFPKYPVVMSMHGVGKTLGPQLIAEIGDVHRFYSKKALVAFPSLDVPSFQSGAFEARMPSFIYSLGLSRFELSNAANVKLYSFAQRSTSLPL